MQLCQRNRECQSVFAQTGCSLACLKIKERRLETYFHKWRFSNEVIYKRKILSPIQWFEEFNEKK